MTQELPLWLQNAAYSARLDRQLISSILGEGVITGMSVTQRAAGANMSVDIGVGRGVIYGDDQANQGGYLAICTAVENFAIAAAPGSGSRRDLVYWRINDPNAGGPAGNNSAFGVVTGTPHATTPVLPTLPTSAIPLAEVSVSVGQGSVVNANITSLRIPSTPYGGDPVGASVEFAGAAASLDLRYIIQDGRAVSRTTYAALFALLSTTYGAGDGSTTFNVPDRRGRTGVGLDNLGGVAANRWTGATALGTSGGAQTVTLAITNMPAHSHTVNSHNHGGTTGLISNDHSHTFSGSTGGQSADHSHGPPGGYLYVGSTLNPSGVVGNGGSQIYQANFFSNTAGTSNDHSHGFSGTTSGVSANHNHSITAEAPGTNSQGSGTAFSILPPWIGYVYAIRAL